MLAVKEWSRLESDEILSSLPICTLRKISELFQLLSSLVLHIVPPPPSLHLTLHHPDLAFRNVFFDPNDDTKIAGVIDRGGAEILPLMLMANFSSELLSTIACVHETRMLVHAPALIRHSSRLPFHIRVVRWLGEREDVSSECITPHSDALRGGTQNPHRR